MRRQQNHIRYLAAAAVLALGSASAASVYLKPPAVSGPNPAQLRQLAERVDQEQPDAEPVLLSIPPRRGAITTPRPERSDRPASNHSTAPTPIKPAPSDTTTPAMDKHAAAEAAVKQIALMGVTQHGEETSAWLVDLGTREREVATSGDSAFGFTVKEVGPESVLLVQGDDQFTLHLGEKEIPVTEPEASSVPALAANGDDRNGRGRWGGRNGGGNWNGGGGRSWSGGSWNRGGGSYSGGYGGGNRNWSGGRSFGSNNSQRSFGGFGGGGGFGGNFQGGNNNRNQSYLKPTANPQEARRRNTRLIGGSDPLPQLQTPRNPQTQRRRGTNSGRAFGSDPNWR